ncbi:MAG: hypothetical protein Tsb0019_28250 [Roseibium sp.]
MIRNAAVFTLTTLMLGGVALADHNSKFGEGTAYDPRGVHDARFDSLDTASEEPFRGGGLTGRLLDAITGRKGRPETVTASGSENSGGSESGSSGGGGGESGSGSSGGGNSGGGNGGGGNGGSGNGGSGNGGGGHGNGGGGRGNGGH